MRRWRRRSQARSSERQPKTRRTSNESPGLRRATGTERTGAPSESWTPSDLRAAPLATAGAGSERQEQKTPLAKPSNSLTDDVRAKGPSHNGPAPAAVRGWGAAHRAEPSSAQWAACTCRGGGSKSGAATSATASPALPHHVVRWPPAAAVDWTALRAHLLVCQIMQMLEQRSFIASHSRASSRTSRPHQKPSIAQHEGAVDSLRTQRRRQQTGATEKGMADERGGAKRKAGLADARKCSVGPVE